MHTHGLTNFVAMYAPVENAANTPSITEAIASQFRGGRFT